MWVRVPVVWVEVSAMETSAPETVSVEAKREFVVEAREISRTFPEIAGVVMAVEYVGANKMLAMSPDTDVPVAADCVRDAVRILPEE